MSLIKYIQQSGVELFISCHPLVKMIKREAKSLHKQNQINNNENKVNLMQYQNIIVKKYGFNNWHHFLQTLKNQYAADLDNKKFISTVTYEENNHYYLGYDYFFKNHKYQDITTARTHRFIYGENTYDKYDVFFAKQSIRLGHNFLFINNDENDNTSFDLIIEEAKKFNREDDIILFKIGQHSFKEDFSFLNTNCLVDIFCSLNSLNKEETNNIIIQYNYILFECLKENEKQEPITLQLIKDNIQTNQFLFKKYNSNFIQEQQIKFIEAMKDISLDNIINEYRQIFENNINHLLKIKLFDKNSTKKINYLENNENSKIYLLQGDQLTNVLFMSLLKCSFYNLLSSRINDYSKIIDKKRVNYDIYLRNIPLIKGFSVIGAQARSLGFSLNFSFKKIQDFSNPELLSIFANSNTKIVSTKEKVFLQSMNKFNFENYAKFSELNYQLPDNEDYAYIIYSSQHFPSVIPNYK